MQAKYFPIMHSIHCILHTWASASKNREPPVEGMQRERANLFLHDPVYENSESGRDRTGSGH